MTLLCCVSARSSACALVQTQKNTYLLHKLLLPGNVKELLSILMSAPSHPPPPPHTHTHTPTHTHTHPHTPTHTHTHPHTPTHTHTHTHTYTHAHMCTTQILDSRHCGGLPYEGAVEAAAEATDAWHVCRGCGQHWGRKSEKEGEKTEKRKGTLRTISSHTAYNPLFPFVLWWRKAAVLVTKWLLFSDRC